MEMADFNTTAQGLFKFPVQLDVSATVTGVYTVEVEVVMRVRHTYSIKVRYSTLERCLEEVLEFIKPIANRVNTMET